MKTAIDQPLDIHGTEFNFADATGKMVLSVACIGLGILLWPLRAGTFWELDSTDAQFGAWTVAILPWFIAGILPYQAHTFLDFVHGRIVTQKYYGWFCIVRHHRPLTDFGRIVVRHVCHPDGEGSDTFTGSVGLKPAKEGAVVWLKELPATQDEMPREAYHFAVRLQTKLGLPMTAPGLDLLAEDSAKSGPVNVPPASDLA